MDIPDQSVGGLFSPVTNVRKNEITHNNYDIEQRIAMDQKNTYHHHTNIYTNSSKNKLLSLSGSNNQAIMFNDARFHTNNVFERPIFFYLNQHSALLSLILVIVLFLIMIFTVIGSFICYRQKRQHLKQKGQQQTTPFIQHRQLNNNRQKKIHHKNNIHLLNNSIVLSTHERIQKDNVQNEKNLLEEKDNNKIDVKVTKCPNIIPQTNIITLPKQDEMSKIRSPTDCQQNSASINIYDAPPVHSTSQWAHDQLLKIYSSFRRQVKMLTIYFNSSDYSQYQFSTFSDPQDVYVYSNDYTIREIIEKLALSNKTFIELNPTLPTAITSGTHENVTHHINDYIKIFQAFINEFTKKQERAFYMILIFFFVFLCISIIIIVIMSKIIGYYSTIQSFTGYRHSYKRVCQYDDEMNTKNKEKRHQLNNNIDNKKKNENMIFFNDHLIIDLHNDATSKMDSCSTFTNQLPASVSTYSIDIDTKNDIIK